MVYKWCDNYNVFVNGGVIKQRIIVLCRKKAPCHVDSMEILWTTTIVGFKCESLKIANCEFFPRAQSLNPKYKIHSTCTYW